MTKVRRVANPLRFVGADTWERLVGRITGAQRKAGHTTIVDIASTCADLSRTLSELGGGNERFWLRASRGTTKKLVQQSKQLHRQVRWLKRDALADHKTKTHVVRGDSPEA